MIIFLSCLNLWMRIDLSVAFGVSCPMALLP